MEGTPGHAEPYVEGHVQGKLGWEGMAGPWAEERTGADDKQACSGNQTIVNGEVHGLDGGDSLKGANSEEGGIFAAQIKDLSTKREMQLSSGSVLPDADAVSTKDQSVRETTTSDADDSTGIVVAGEQSNQKSSTQITSDGTSPIQSVGGATLLGMINSVITSIQASDAPSSQADSALSIAKEELSPSTNESNQKRYKMESEIEKDVQMNNPSIAETKKTMNTREANRFKPPIIDVPTEQEDSEESDDSSDDSEWHPDMDSDAEDMAVVRVAEESDDEMAECEMSKEMLEKRYNQMCRVAQIPSVLSNPTPEHYRQQLTSRADHSGRLIWQPDNCIDDTELAKYLEAALPTLRVGRTGFNLPTPRDLQITTILATLTLNGCDVDKAKEELQKNAPRTLAWSNSDIVNFEIELVQHGKDFERFKIAGRSYNEIINFYFQWMRSPRCRSFVNTFMDVWYRSNCGPIHDCNEVIINWKRQIGLFRVAAVLDRRKRGTRWEYKVRWEDTDVETWEDKDSKGLRTSEAFSKYKRSLKE